MGPSARIMLWFCLSGWAANMIYWITVLKLLEIEPPEMSYGLIGAALIFLGIGVAPLTVLAFRRVRRTVLLVWWGMFGVVAWLDVMNAALLLLQALATSWFGGPIPEDSVVTVGYNARV